MPIIDIVNLSKTYRVPVKEPGFIGSLSSFFHRKYKEVEAVRDVSFTIEPGEIVGFLGPNGAGKTTTLKMLTGLIHPSSGQATVAGHVPFQRQKPFLKQITLVMGQKQQLIWDLPALDSLRINAAVYEIPETIFQERLHELSEMLELSELLRQPVRKLSLGERMKAELLAALIHQPDILFLDEPTLGLDVNAQASVRRFLREYNRRYHSSILITSHYMADITALCQRVILIHKGSLMYDGDLNGILHRFAPYREVKIELSQDIPENALDSYGEVVAREGRQIRLLVQRQGLTSTVSRLLNEIALSDVTVTDPPVEEIIGRIFQQGAAGQ